MKDNKSYYYFLKCTINKQILLEACYFFFIGHSFSEIFETYKINFLNISCLLG